MTVEASQQEEALRSRCDLARRLLGCVDRLAGRLGDVSIAVELQLLKRDLARSHDLLASFPSENDFLSVVTLVEAALASLTWKQYTPSILDALRQAFTAGAAETPFSFSDYETVRRQFRTATILTAPLID
jgi:hypothetical protein